MLAMKTIFVINDQSSEALHAVKFALTIASKLQANILLANTVSVNQPVRLKVLAGGIADDTEKGRFSIDPYANMYRNDQPGFKPAIESIEISGMDESAIAAVINKRQVWMLIKGIVNVLPAGASKGKLNIHAILNKILCPLLLIPESAPIKSIERLVYITDLRYCNLPFVKQLAELAKPYDAYLSIANIPKSGLPEMAEKYALNVFSEEIYPNIKYERLLLINVKEKDFKKLIDVLINGMGNDLLVLVNRCSHFIEILGRYITDTLPLHITMPLLVFPT